jgi:drug/metabolite transporter (DMT)-like permease
MVPAMCDLVSSTLHFIALNYISASAYQMLTGGNIVVTFILSIFFLRQPVIKSHLFGSIFAFVGILVVGFANIVTANQTN